MNCLLKGILKWETVTITSSEISPPPICDEYEINNNCGPAHRLFVCVWGGGHHFTDYFSLVENNIPLH